MDSLDLNFVAPLPPEQCAAYLKDFAASHSSMSVRTRVDLRRGKNGSYTFRLDRSFYSLPTHRRYRGYRGMTVGRSNYIKIRVEGHLAAWADSGTTIVLARARILPKTYVVNGALLLAVSAVALLLTVAVIGDFLCFAPLILLVLLSFAHMTLLQPEDLGQRHTHNLLKQLRQTLEKRGYAAQRIPEFA